MSAGSATPPSGSESVIVSHKPKLLSDERLAAAINRTLVGQAQPLIESLRQEVSRQHETGLIRIAAGAVGKVIGEIDALREVTAALGGEVRASRDNIQLARDAAPAGSQACKNCRYFEAVKSSEAHTVGTRQAIVNEPGICRYGPPSPMLRGAAGPPNASFFTPVHPARWCGRWEPIDQHEEPGA